MRHLNLLFELDTNAHQSTLKNIHLDINQSPIE